MRRCLGFLAGFARRADGRRPPAGLATALMVSMTLTSCTGGDEVRQPSAQTAFGTDWTRFGHLGAPFDPLAVRPGSRVGNLRVASVLASRAIDSTIVGSARFEGELLLRGIRARNPDADSPSICFEADSSSAMQLPRWRGDERRPWFCFEHSPDIIGKFDGIEERDSVAVVVDRYTIHRGMSDEVNSARLLRLLAAGPGIALLQSPVGLGLDTHESWSYRRSGSADLDGDGRPERVVLTSNVAVSRGRALWEDGHHWILYVEEAGGARTYLYSRFIPHGLAEGWLPAPGADGDQRILLRERSPDGLRSYEFRYRGPLRAGFVERGGVETVRGVELAGTPN